MANFFLQVALPVNVDTDNDLDRLIRIVKICKDLGSDLSNIQITADFEKRRYILGTIIPECRSDLQFPLTEEEFFRVAQEYLNG